MKNLLAALLIGFSPVASASTCDTLADIAESYATSYYLGADIREVVHGDEPDIVIEIAIAAFDLPRRPDDWQAEVDNFQSEVHSMCEGE